MTGHDIVVWREARGWNQHVAAGHLGITRRTIQRWEASKDELPAYVGLACAQLDAIEAAKPPAQPEPEGDTHKQVDWLVDTLTDQKPRIIGALKEHGPLTRHEIADVTGIPLGSVCARITALIKRSVVEQGEKVPGEGRFPRYKIQLTETRQKATLARAGDDNS